MKNYTIKQVASKFGVPASYILSILGLHREEFEENSHYQESESEIQFTREGVMVIGMHLRTKSGTRFRNQIIQDLKKGAGFDQLTEMD